MQGKIRLDSGVWDLHSYQSARAITDRCVLIKRILRPFALISAQTRISVYSVLYRDLMAKRTRKCVSGLTGC